MARGRMRWDGIRRRRTGGSEHYNTLEDSKTILCADEIVEELEVLSLGETVALQKWHQRHPSSSTVRSVCSRSKS